MALGYFKNRLSYFTKIIKDKNKEKQDKKPKVSNFTKEKKK